MHTGYPLGIFHTAFSAARAQRRSRKHSSLKTVFWGTAFCEKAVQILEETYSEICK